MRRLLFAGFVMIIASGSIVAEEDFADAFSDSHSTETANETAEPNGSEGTSNTSSSQSDWATSSGSCYGKGDIIVSAGIPLWPFGLYGAFDYGFHDCISGGGGFGFYGYSYSSLWKYRYLPIGIRAAFHPFNLEVLADKIPVRDKLDAYAGLAFGQRIGWASWEGAGAKLEEPEVGGFMVREYIGIRYFPTDNFFLTAEEGGLTWTLNIGVGLKF
ncbi:MAG: hypothetical protein GF401_10585 [Chitinivibrionales bacterium]|nr:hypothetical protein [Chitinivibrionales bacterium]